MMWTFLYKNWFPITISAVVLAAFLYVTYLYNKVTSLQGELQVVTENLEVQSQKLLVMGQLQESYRLQLENYIKELKWLNEDLQTQLGVVQSASEEEKGKKVSDYIKRVINSIPE